MFDKSNDFDQQTSRINGLLRKKAVRASWYVMTLLLAAFQIRMFLRQKRPFFHSTLEMVSVFALVAVFLLGIFVKSRQDGRN